jgi:hypothetical protein
VAVLIQRHFGVHYHPAHVYRLLVRRLHWTSQKPQKRARERNVKEVERWIADDWPRIIRQAYQRRARIALLDESGFMLAPVVRRTMAPRGKTPILVCSNKHDRISVLSAITLSPRAQRVGLHFMLLGKDDNFHGEEIVLFLQQLKGEVGGPAAIPYGIQGVSLFIHLSTEQKEPRVRKDRRKEERGWGGQGKSMVKDGKRMG